MAEFECMKTNLNNYVSLFPKYIFDGPHRQVGPSLWLLILANIFHFAIDFALKGVTLEKVMGIIRFGDFEFSASP